MFLKGERRLYPIDPGIGKPFGNDTGYLTETAVLAELLKEGYEDIWYWRTKYGAEVDFVVEGTPIEVKFRERGSLKGLRSFIEKYKPSRAIVVFLRGKERRTQIERTEVFFVPLWKLRDVIKVRT